MKTTNLLLIVILFLSISLISKSTKAQNYKTGIGLRLGWEYGFSVKHFFTQRLAIEGLVSSRFYGKYTAGKYTKHTKHTHHSHTRHGHTKHGTAGGVSPYSWGLSSGGVNFTGLLQWHFPIGNISGLKWFIGGGIHIGFWEAEHNHYWFPTRTLPNGNLKRVYVLTGIDAIAGIEYTLANLPITFQLDIKPSLHFGEWFGLWYDTIGITARYTFK